MALTDKQKEDVVLFLGWPTKTLVPDSTHFSNIFYDRLNNLSVEGEIKVIDLITKIDEVRTNIHEAQCRLVAEKVDNVTLNQDEIDELWDLERRYIQILSEYLDLPIMRKGGSVNGCITV